ncbi:predicted ORF [Xanthomonas phage XacN1]|nr:predicted ORF [Xanthomonas phage XacN1]BBA65622.1 predicted ORF [Xanthomonas phage XacN1]
MSSDSQYIPSTQEGYHWNLYTHKPDGRPGYAMAVEGKVERREDGSVRSFETIIFQDRQVRQNIPGRMTVKNRNNGLCALFDTLVEKGYIDKRESLKTVS